MPLGKFSGYFLLNQKINLAWNHQETAKSCTSLLVRCVGCEIACHWFPHLLEVHRIDVQGAMGQTVRAITQRDVLIVSAVMTAGMRAVSTGCCAYSSLDYVSLHGFLMHGCVALDRVALQAFSGITGRCWRGSVYTKRLQKCGTHTKYKQRFSWTSRVSFITAGVWWDRHI